MEFTPCNDRVLIEVDPDEEETTGGIVMPKGSVEDIHKWATVIKVGPGRVSKKGVRIPIDLKPGDRVLYVRFLERTETGKSLHASLGPNQFLIQEQDVIAVEEETA